jgi:polyphosphate glucokinase
VNPLPTFDRISVGLPGYIRTEKVIAAPEFGNRIWHGFDLVKALQSQLGKPARLIKNADMQRLPVIGGKGLEPVVTLGTGLGTTLLRDGELTPHLELAHHPAHKGADYNGYLGKEAPKKIGKKRWNCRVRRTIGVSHDLFHFDKLYTGGGSARNITFRPNAHIKLISNRDDKFSAGSCYGTSTEG